LNLKNPENRINGTIKHTENKTVSSVKKKAKSVGQPKGNHPKINLTRCRTSDRFFEPYKYKL
jgi:hypothetical protein